MLNPARSLHPGSLEQPTRHSTHSIVCLCFSNNLEVKPPNCRRTPSSARSLRIRLESDQIRKIKPTSLRMPSWIWLLHFHYYDPCERNWELIWIKCGSSLDSQSGLTRPCERGSNVTCTLVTSMCIILRMIFSFVSSKLAVCWPGVPEVSALGLFFIHSWLFS